MAKKTVEVKKKDKFKVEFVKDFNGAFNDRYFVNKTGDIITVNAAELDWLSKKGVIEC